nr:ABC transporter substrate-binding protein [Streptomyces durbertensis]
MGLALAPVMAVGLLTACGTPDRAESGKRAEADGFPLTVTNCGVKTTYEQPPERVVTIHQHPAELMLALGLEKRMVGTAFPDSAVLPEYREKFKAIPELSKKEPSFENVLEAEPDLVYGGYASAFAEKTGRSRAAFEKAGINTHLNREYCEGAKSATMKDVHAEIRTLGEMFGVADRAEKLNAELRGKVDAVAKKVEDRKPVPVFVYDSGDKSAFTAGGRGLGTEIIRLAGGKNIFADVDEVFADVSWEQVIDRKPEVIAIYHYAGAGSVESKKKFLLSQPALADVPAIRNKRFVVVPLTATLVGVRPPYAVEDMAKALHPERFE